MKTILILAANPRSDLRVDREIRDLEKAIERSKNSDKFTIKIKLAVLPEDLQEFLYDNKPYIVHFCGHGIKENYLVFESEDRGEQKVSYQAFSNLLKNSNSRENIQCVLLNACHTEPLVDLIVEYIPYAIGTSREILDMAAYW
ncbi:MAG: CHAT domain-containing protein, partial [Xenococcus sp. (in: cyanobacteria)]